MQPSPSVSKQSQPPMAMYTGKNVIFKRKSNSHGAEVSGVRSSHNY